MLGCASDEFPTRFRASQIERLLSAGSLATWQPVSIISQGTQLLGNCADSIRFLVVQSVDDSLQVSQLQPLCDGTGVLDTMLIGKAKASAEEALFTDSLLFADGQFWIIQEVFSTQVNFSYNDRQFFMQRE